MHFFKVVLISSAMALLKTSSKASVCNFSGWQESSSIRIFSGFSWVTLLFANPKSSMNPGIFRGCIITVESPWWMATMPLVWTFTLILPAILRVNSRNNGSPSAHFQTQSWKRMRRNGFRIFARSCRNLIGCQLNKGQWLGRKEFLFNGSFRREPLSRWCTLKRGNG